MNNSRFYSFTIAALLVVLLIAFLACGPTAIGASPKAAKSQTSYAIYLSPGPNAGVPFGGYHVTITGFQNKQFTVAMKNAVLKAWKDANGGGAFFFRNTVPDFKKSSKKEKYLGKNIVLGYQVFFTSNVLNTFAKELKSSKLFKGVKADNWHVTLYTESLSSAKTLWAILDTNTPWYLWEVKKVGIGSKATYTWTQIK